ncbi:hypothetical protein DY000_02039656 [Brassica cretica]|uniref:Uncharacterized protein n=1 Tax=Brassica cretica TaxID=69181 RepID=A0ABQ7BGP2_BRACR|nr:hypothetical protein DY000_02039656 [Brassica cretica]
MAAGHSSVLAQFECDSSISWSMSSFSYSSWADELTSSVDVAKAVQGRTGRTIRTVRTNPPLDQEEKLPSERGKRPMGFYLREDDRLDG